MIIAYNTPDDPTPSGGNDSGNAETGAGEKEAKKYIFRTDRKPWLAINSSEDIIQNDMHRILAK